MATERPPLGERDGTGSWHPAMRPDSYTIGGNQVAPHSIQNDARYLVSDSELQSDSIPANSTVVLEKPLDFEGGYGGPIADLQQNAESDGVLNQLQSLRSETTAIDERQDHSISASLSDVQLSGSELNGGGQEVDEGRQENEGHRMEPSTAQPGLQARKDIDMSETDHVSFAHGFAQDEQQASGSTLELSQDMAARKEIDEAFRSRPHQEDTSNDDVAIDTENTFPEVLPLDGTTNLPAYPLPKSQAEDIMEDEKALDEDQGFFDDDFPLADQGVPASEGHDYFESMGDAVAGSSTAPPADDEIRYEEGLPLVPSEHVLVGDNNDILAYNSVHMSPHNNGLKDNAETSQPSVDALDDSSPFRPQPLDRKTTTQVLNAMHYIPHGNTPQRSANEESLEQEDDLPERPSFADLTGGGIAVSTETVKSEVFADEALQHGVALAREDDLADMWKAALGDDDIFNDNENPMDPSALFGDDDGFLDDLAKEDEGASNMPMSPPLQAVYNADGGVKGFSKAGQSTASGTSRYVPTETSHSQQNNLSTYQQQISIGPNSRLPQGMTGFESSIQTPIGFGAPEATTQQSYGALAPPRPPMPSSAQSFADKSKGGYTSPYDLPMDITRPKKRSHVHHNAPPNPTPPLPPNRLPPPRSSSMLVSPPSTHRPQPAAGSELRPGPVTRAVNAIAPTLKSSQSTSSFFEELAPKPRPSTSAGKYSPHPSQQQMEHAPPVASSLSRQASTDGYSPQAGAHASQAYQLQQPEKMSLFGSTPVQQPPNQPVSTINSRYSPAPPQPSGVPPSRTRYASSPMAVSQNSAQGMPFQPRTSSPLAQSSLPRQSAYAADTSQNRPASDGQQPQAVLHSAAPQMPYPNIRDQRGAVLGNDFPQDMSPSAVNTRYAPLSDSPSSGSQAMNTPSSDRLSSDDSNNHQNPFDLASIQTSGAHRRLPPQRSQTQSPGAARTNQEMPPIPAPNQRPASVTDKRASVATYTPSASVPERAGRARGYSEATNFIAPADGRELDPLERWKGCPIMTFGFGGIVISSFPVRIPRYAAGQKTPLVKCSPGEIKIRGSKLFTLDGTIATFPGPLKAKGKKKEVLEWMQNRIGGLQSSTATIAGNATLPDPVTCHQEKILLWQIVRIIVEYDGVVDGNKTAEQAVRAILSPELCQGDATTGADAGAAPFASRIIHRNGATDIAATGNQGAMEELRTDLLRGDREKAIWLAVDNRMWAHAMLIATTLDPNIRKQVSSEFIKHEVKSYGENTESLSALYQIFSGNGEESIDELVPPSARAGLQMISKATNHAPAKNALDGLDRWRETLTLIISNRTPDDGKALVSLGQLLAGYGRTEAAHVCYVFAKSPALFGGPDDPQVSVALLGADHIGHSSDYGRDMDSILLTEVYEFATTVLAPTSIVTVSPHLQSYKLYHAMLLAEHGHKTEAQQYCDAVTSGLKSTTKLSPYYHPLLFGALENLTERLRQAPKDGSNSWISRPSIDKVSGSIWAKFNSYVAGDESETASNGSGMPNEAEAGPFARVISDSPNLSRSPSVGDLYSSSGLGLAPASMPMTQPVNSRYAPAGLYPAKSTQEQSRSSSQEPQRQNSLRSTYPQQQYQIKTTAPNGAVHEPRKPQSQPTSYIPQQGIYPSTIPTPPNHRSEILSDQPMPQLNSYQPTLPHAPPTQAEDHETSSENLSPRNYGPSPGYQPPLSYEPVPADNQESFPYEPPSSVGYEPPSYEPPSYEPPSYDPDITQDVPPKREPSRHDDDEDDFEARAAAMRKQERAKKDREADESMRKAAEEDGKLDSVFILFFICR